MAGPPQTRAQEASIDVGAITDAMDAENPKVALAKLVARSVSSDLETDRTKLLAELGSLKLSQLQTRSSSTPGVDPEAVAAALDEDNPRQALMDLLLTQQTQAVTKMSRPHFGDGSEIVAVTGLDAAPGMASQTARPQPGQRCVQPMPTLVESPVMMRLRWIRIECCAESADSVHCHWLRHVMLSYQWDIQPVALMVREALVRPPVTDNTATLLSQPICHDLSIRA